MGESLSSLCTSSLENVSAVGGLHSLAETVLNFSLALFGLISSEHLNITSFSFGTSETNRRAVFDSTVV